MERLSDAFSPNDIGPMKPGRICFTCKHRISRNSNFITCKHNNKRKFIWEKAHCAKWRLTTDKKALAQYEKLTEMQGLDDAQRRSFFFKKHTKVKVRDQAQIKLGRCCFLCEHRGVKQRSKVVCNKRDGELVWEKGTCKKFLLTKRWKRLDQYKRYMNKSGVKTDDNVDWIRHSK